MISIYKTEEKALLPLEAPLQEKCWVNLVGPTHNELHQLQAEYDLPLELLTAALDPDERARFEVEEGVMLILVRIPIANDDEESDVPYITRPLGIILARDLLITVCTKENTVLTDFIERKVKDFNPENRMRFLLQIFYRTTLKYLRFLREIDAQTNKIEAELQESLKNQELIRLLNQEKSLVFFTTSLRSNQIMMERLRKTSFFHLAQEEDRELLEDILIDNTQAIEMANVYTNILNGLMDAFASVISNNLNVVMKSLTKVTIILMLPTLVASIFGMNVRLPLQDMPGAFIYVMAFCLVAVLTGVFLFSVRKGL